MIDIGLTHIALPVSDVDRTIEFYSNKLTAGIKTNLS